MNHPFMKLFIKTLDSIADKMGADAAQSVNEIKNMRALFDILMASFGQAKKSVGDPSAMERIDLTITKLIANWGDLSQRYTGEHNS